MKFVHDQTVKMMETTDNYDEIVNSVKLPKNLVESPWLVQTYGKLEWAVKGRNIFFSKLYNHYIRYLRFVYWLVRRYLQKPSTAEFQKIFRKYSRIGGNRKNRNQNS